MDYASSPLSTTPEPVPSASPSLLQAKRSASRLGWGCFLLMTVTQVGAGVLVVFLQLVAGVNPLDNSWLAWLMSYLPLYGLGLPLMWLLIRRLPTAWPRGQQNFSPLRLGLLAVFCLGATYAFNFLSFGITSLLGLLKGAPVMNPLAMMVKDPLPTFFFACLLAPVMEELIFRKLLLNRLLPFGQGFAVFGSAFVFALFHANLSQMFYAFVLGLVLAWVTLESGGTRFSTILHVAINIVGTLGLPLLFGQPVWGQWVGWALIVLFILGALLLLRRGPRVVLEPSPLGAPPRAQRRAFLLNSGMVVYMVLIALLTLAVVLM